MVIPTSWLSLSRGCPDRYAPHGVSGHPAKPRLPANNHEYLLSLQLCIPNIHTEEGKQCMNSHDITVLIELHQSSEQQLWQPSWLS